MNGERKKDEYWSKFDGLCECKVNLINSMEL